MRKPKPTLKPKPTIQPLVMPAIRENERLREQIEAYEDYVQALLQDRAGLIGTFRDVLTSAERLLGEHCPQPSTDNTVRSSDGPRTLIASLVTRFEANLLAHILGGLWEINHGPIPQLLVEDTEE